MRTLFVILGPVLGVLLILFLWISGSGSSAAEQWLEGPLKAIINAHLNGELSFNNLDYQAPGTVHLDNVLLTSGMTDIVSAMRVTLTLADVPRKGKPLRIKDLRVEEPQIRLVREGSGVAGFAKLFKSQSTDQRDQDDEQTRLSEVFEIRRCAISNGRVCFENMPGATVIDGISAEMTVTPQTGWYSIHAAVKRKPHFGMTLIAGINLDTLTLRMDPDAKELVRIDMDLHRDNDKYLPREIAAYVQRHQAQGKLQIALHGVVPIESPAAAKCELTLRLDGAQFSVDQFTMPLKLVEGRAQYDQNKMVFSVNAECLEGKLTAEGNVDVQQATASVGVAIIKPLDLKRTIAETPRINYAGLLAGELDLHRKGGSLSGKGRLEITNAEFQHLLAGLSDNVLVETMGNDVASVDLDVHDDRVVLKNLRIEIASAEMRGGGEVRFDETLDITLAIRPLGLGRILGLVTERFEKTIRGSVRDLEIE